MNLSNLIDLRDRTKEDRRRIARLGGLARQEQRRRVYRQKKALDDLIEIEDFISQYVKRRKANRINLRHTGNGYRNLIAYNSCYYSATIEDFNKAYNIYLKEIEEENLRKEKKRKRQRKKINKRYYEKHKKALRKH